jgi:hypothetical protein
LGIVYRFQQFWIAWTASPSVKDLERAHEFLSPALMDLFLQMQPSEQAHSLSIFKEMKDMGERSPDLLAAGLLHDVGKCRYPLSPWERALIVVFRRISPSLVDEWSNSAPHGWKKPFAVYARHPDWGADMVKEAGGSPLIVNLIRRHQDPINGDQRAGMTHHNSEQALEDGFLMRLQKLDNES